MVQPNTEGPYQVRYEILDSGESATAGFQTNAARFDWLANTKGIRGLEYINPEPNGSVSTVPVTIGDEELAERQRLVAAGQERIAQDEVVGNWTDAVAEWIYANVAALGKEASRREMTVPELLVEMLEDVFEIYDTEPPEETAVRVEARKRQLARDAQMHRASIGHQCTRETMTNVAAYGAPGIGYHGTCGVCGVDWSIVGDNLHDPAAGVHLIEDPRYFE